MACFLGISDAAEECVICGGPVPAGLAKNDPRLMAVLMLVESMHAVSSLMRPDSDLEHLAEEVRELLRLIRTCLPPRGQS